MNSARLVSTRFAGVLCKPRPDLKNDSATTKRVKLVTMIRSLGAIESTVRIATICTTRAVAEDPPVGIRALRSTLCAWAAEAQTNDARIAIAMRFIAPPGFA